VRLFIRSILTVGFFSLSLVGASSETLESSEISPVERAPETSLSSELIEVKFGSSIYRVPRNYLAGVTQPNAKNEYAAKAGTWLVVGTVGGVIIFSNST
jgi:hypothetical protein